MNFCINRAVRAVVYAILLCLALSCRKEPQVDPEPEITVTLTPTEISLTKGQSQKLSASVEPAEYASELKWLVGDDSVVSLSGNVLTARKAGHTTVYAFVRNTKAQCYVTVSDVQPEAVVLSQTDVTLRKDDTVQLTASLTPEGAPGEVSWRSADESVAMVSESGLVTAVGYGKTTVIARCGLLTAECRIVVELADPKVGDFFYSDGTWSDGAGDPVEGKTVIGIVFQTNPDRIYDGDKSAGYTHGYVVSTHIAQYPENAETMYSLDEGIDCLDNCKTGTSWYSNLKGSWETAQVYGTYAQSSKSYLVPAFTLVVEDFEAAPGNTSGWFLPSTGQLWDMVSNFCGDEVAAMLDEYSKLTYDVTYERGISASYDVIARFNEMAAKVPASMKDDLYVPKSEEYHNYCGIWTSTLYDNSDGAACLFYLGNSKGKTFVCGDWVDNPYFVKPVLAF